jgi:hypothetical protein
MLFRHDNGISAPLLASNNKENSKQNCNWP